MRPYCPSRELSMFPFGHHHVFACKDTTNLLHSASSHVSLISTFVSHLPKEPPAKEVCSITTSKESPAKATAADGEQTEGEERDIPACPDGQAGMSIGGGGELRTNMRGTQPSQGHTREGRHASFAGTHKRGRHQTSAGSHERGGTKPSQGIEAEAGEGEGQRLRP